MRVGLATCEILPERRGNRGKSQWLSGMHLCLDTQSVLLYL
ncbi:hypothetical protein YPPY66_4987 [Yersinia pestis PY-66]|uniref:Uncharacterized protein n=3 Tax=Yersinia pseudotuberculosis complex TaxID=1649845 RepID=A0AAX2HVB4_YERPE|nr:hypothetical protein A1122_05490 [Yersinia pestis A1122]AIN15021.1 hypothetical protein DJ40_2491 [Yersinia pseudotuberculosis]AJI89475.1 hypothetical protein CH59_2023 [Yersinia pestis]AJI97650.1 hypothetical protein BZ18_535 [Yersinia pestis Pestoides F]AJJ53741.1 hypothetical protein BZ17_2660 [Yersinia pseudotuberculosis IP 32953]AJJ60378.1 hypothetical protein BZ22_617 [Yersinia pseudotuberculosis YPIII]AJJ66683.1 hypothetical protein BZ16_3390 [Yersinia pseudotuberculosis PB1/+]AJJ7